MLAALEIFTAQPFFPRNISLNCKGAYLLCNVTDLPGCETVLGVPDLCVSFAQLVTVLDHIKHALCV